MRARAASSFVFVLILLTLLGHACELPIGTMLSAHAHEEESGHGDHHSGDGEAACEAVLAVPRTVQTPVPLDFVGHASTDALGIPVRLQVVGAPRPERHAARHGPPLFLLHSALLI